MAGLLMSTSLPAACQRSAHASTARRLASYFEGLPFEVVLVDAIPSDASGKRRAVVVERSAPASSRSKGSGGCDFDYGEAASFTGASG